MIEIDKVAKLTQEIAGEAIGNSHFKSILVGMLDPLTRQHTSNLMGSNTSADDLKRAILELTTNAVLDSNDGMEIGAVGGQGGQGEPGGDGPEESEESHDD